MKSIIVFLILTSLCTGKLAGQSRIVYTCPPCLDGSCDGTFADSPGVCEKCQMPYVATFKVLQFPAVTHRSPTVAILIYPGVDVMDLSGPYSVFGYAHMRIRTVAKTGGMVRAAGGLTIQADYSFANFPGADIIVVPGGGPAESEQDKEIVAWVASLHSPTILSVCSGAFFLASSGQLDGLSATTFASLIPQLKVDAPKTRVVDDRRFVDNGRIVTSAGLTSGIDAAFHLVRRLYGEGRARQVANQMEYNWEPEGTFVRAQLADKYLNHPLQAFSLFTDSLVSLRGDRKNYEARIRVRFELPDNDLARLIDHNMASNSSFRKVSGRGLNNTWIFHGDGESLWTLTVSGRRQSDAKLDFILRVSEKLNGSK